MFCTKCGDEMPDDALFCISCGEKLGEEAKDKAVQVAASAPEGGKKNRKQILASRKLIVSAGIAAAIVVGGIAVGVIMLNQPKVVVLRAAESTWNAVRTEESGIAEYVGLRQLYKSIQDAKTVQNLNVEVVTDDHSLEVKTDIKKDGKKGMLLNSSYTLGGMSIIEATLYHNQEKTTASIPGLYHKTFYVDHNELREKMKSSTFLAQMSDYFSLKLSKTDLDSPGLMKRYWVASEEDWKTLYKNMEIEKLDKKDFLIDGKKKSCRGYRLIISKSDLKRVMEEFVDSALEDGIFLSVVSTNDWTEPERIKQYIKNSSRSALSFMKKDLELQIYISPKGRIVFAESEYPLYTERGNVRLKGSMKLTGKKNPLDNLELQGEGSLNAASTEWISLTRNMSDSDEWIRDLVEVTFSSPSANIGTVMSLNTEMDKKKGSWLVEAALNDRGEKIFAVAEGSVEDIKRGKSMTLLLDDVSAGTSGSYGMDMPLLNVTASYGIGPLNDEIEEPGAGASQLNVLAFSAADFNAVGEEMMINLYNGGLSSLKSVFMNGSSPAETTETTTAPPPAAEGY